MVFVLYHNGPNLLKITPAEHCWYMTAVDPPVNWRRWTVKTRSCWLKSSGWRRRRRSCGCDGVGSHIYADCFLLQGNLKRYLLDTDFNNFLWVIYSWMLHSEITSVKEDLVLQSGGFSSAHICEKQNLVLATQKCIVTPVILNLLYVLRNSPVTHFV